MLEQTFDSPFRTHTLRTSPNGPLLEDFAQNLAAAGYAQLSAGRHIHAAEHFLYWADKAGSPPAVALLGNYGIGALRPISPPVQPNWWENIFK